jgi:hypothetical protein
MNPEDFQYTRVEFERRFLVSPGESWRNSVETYSKTFEDKYISLEDLMSAEPPPYVTEEVTKDPFFDGGNLCRTRREDLLRKLGETATGD